MKQLNSLEMLELIEKAKTQVNEEGSVFDFTNISEDKKNSIGIAEVAYNIPVSEMTEVQRQFIKGYHKFMRLNTSKKVARGR